MVRLMGLPSRRQGRVIVNSAAEVRVVDGGLVRWCVGVDASAAIKPVPDGCPVSMLFASHWAICRVACAKPRPHLCMNTYEF